MSHDTISPIPPNLLTSTALSDSICSTAEGTSVASARKSPVWVPDEEAESCERCKKPFSYNPLHTVRRHHCRVCGACVCSHCSESRLRLDAASKPERACDICAAAAPRLRTTFRFLDDLEARLANMARADPLSPPTAAVPTASQKDDSFSQRDCEAAVNASLNAGAQGTLTPTDFEIKLLLEKVSSTTNELERVWRLREEELREGRCESADTYLTRPLGSLARQSRTSDDYQSCRPQRCTANCSVM